MTNRITLCARLLDAPKVRRWESRRGSVEAISLWIEVRDGERKHRFTVDVGCPKASSLARALPKGALAEATGALRQDRVGTRTPVPGSARSSFPYFEGGDA